MIFYNNRIYIDLNNYLEFKLLYLQIKLFELFNKIKNKEVK
jgi:hypothetical protein